MFGLLLPSALPVEGLPPFRVILPDPAGAPAGGDPRSSSSGGEDVWGWARVSRPPVDAAGAPTTISLSADELACLHACQDCYHALIKDAASPNPEPWASGSRPAAERLGAWRAAMGLDALKQAAQRLGQQHLGSSQHDKLNEPEPSATSPICGQYIWCIVPLSQQEAPSPHVGSHPAGRDVIDWASIQAMASSAAPLTRLPEWPAAIASQSASGANKTDFSSLESRVQQHGVIVAMHSGKLHVARELQLGMSPMSAFPDADVEKSYGEYFRRYGKALSMTVTFCRAHWDPYLMCSPAFGSSNAVSSLYASPSLPFHTCSRYGILEPLDLHQPLLRAALSTGRGRVNLLPTRGDLISGPGRLHGVRLSPPRQGGRDGDAAARGGEAGEDPRRAGSPLEVAPHLLPHSAASEVHLLPQLVALHPLSLENWQALNQVRRLLQRLTCCILPATYSEMSRVQPLGGGAALLRHAFLQVLV